jgi:hypothetical protein
MGLILPPHGDSSVGWEERSDTHQIAEQAANSRWVSQGLNPAYKAHGL